MDLKEAFDTLDATLGMFSYIASEIDNGELKEDFLLTRIDSSIETFADEKMNFELKNREYYTYIDCDKEYKLYIVDIRPVCSYLINEWPSPNTIKIRKRLNEVFYECLKLIKEPLRGIIDIATDEGYSYHMLYNTGTQDSRTLEAALLDIIHEMYHALKLTKNTESEESNQAISPDTERRLLEKIHELTAEVHMLKKENEKLEQLNKIPQIKAQNEIDQLRIKCYEWKQKYEEAFKKEAEIIKAQSEIINLRKERDELMRKCEMAPDKEPEVAFNAVTRNKCFTKAKMGLLIYTIASITDGPLPKKADLVPIISEIGGWQDTSVSSEMKKAGFSQNDINHVASLFENAMPTFADKIKNLTARKKNEKK